MRKVIVLEFITLDGVIQAGGGPEEDTSGGFKYGGGPAPHSHDVLGTLIERQVKVPFCLLLWGTTFFIFAASRPHHAGISTGVILVHYERAGAITTNTVSESRHP